MTMRYLAEVYCRRAGAIGEFYSLLFRVSAESDHDARYKAIQAAIDAGLETRGCSVILEWADDT